MDQCIVNVAFPFAPVRDDTPGGAEQVLLSIEKELVKNKKDSIVVAHESSCVKSRLVRIDSVKRNIDDIEKEIIFKNVRNVIEKIIVENQVDLIHFHGIDFCEYIPQTDVRKVATLHLPVSLYNKDSVNSTCIPFNCVSEWQHNECQGFNHQLEYITNGIPIPKSVNTRRKSAYALSLGRIRPEKGYHLAIEAAKRASIPFVLAGEVFNYSDHIWYYKTKIKSSLDYSNCRFIGKVGPVQKKRLFDNARCLLIPSLIEETSSLVAMEAMAHGVPVIAFKKGALKKIIIDGVNGFLVNDQYEMAEAIKCTGLISADVCYSIAKEKYDVRFMVEKYLKMYKRLLDE
jgi:glycosyltransferase involved in cell wall biosynthesis